MLKKIFDYFARKVINFSLIFFEAKLSLSVCIPAFLINLIMSVYPSPIFLNFLLSNLSSIIMYLNAGFTISPCLSFSTCFFLHL